MPRRVSFLCSLGDITIGWESSNDAKVLPILEQMLNNGVRFFILKDSEEVEVKQSLQGANLRKVVIPDASLDQLYASGILSVGASLMTEPTGEIVKEITELTDHDAVAVQPVRGG